ncbi:MAG: pyruvate dehydrogenase (acetyl-transferring), homodimeric type, partial [Planctomycetes bacterium]|nr:pyruvate dehydrogenase (acetyl-transferring), homodimeric type [Planctomycetota bacterium]
ERRIRLILRWNALAMVMRANRLEPGIGGHLATYASSCHLFEVGFNHFFRGRTDPSPGDQVYIQGHASPGIYARAFLEGRLSRERIEHFRREAGGPGVSSYPHPRLMPEFWEFPTVSMGLGPLSAIYQARFNRYLANRGILDTSPSRVWCFLGDGESDEPEALGALSVASREGLDNLVFVVNCNLQRLDGPVRGNGKIIQELEGIFRGAGWNVIKVIWGTAWDALLARDEHGLLKKRMMEAVDGDYQKYGADGAYVREHFFGAHEGLRAMVEHLSDEELRFLHRGGHDVRKIHAAYAAACRPNGRPTAILAKTVKGWFLGEGIEASNVAHQQKKVGVETLRRFRDILDLPLSDAELAEAPLYHPGPESEEVRYMLERRRALGGPIPRRIARPVSLSTPPLDAFKTFFEGSKEGQTFSTTMVFARLLGMLLRDKEIGPRIVPIIPDEARTFGLDALFSQAGIYSAVGQKYEPVDRRSLLYYREAKDGQILEEGITEAGSVASFTAAGTSYATHGQPMIPFYVFYSMFGFQRTGDLLWAFGDARGRGFLLGATAGRTTLNGEGLQHQDGQSHLLASAIPNVRCYEPAFAYELAILLHDGLERMYARDEDVFYYITLQNENYAHPPIPEESSEGIVRGLYRFRPAAASEGPRVQLLGSGSILLEALRAQGILAEKYGVAADVWSATSWQMLRRDALAAERWNLLHPDRPPRKPYVTEVLENAPGPVVAATDWMKALPDGIAKWVPGGLHSLGTDGYGRSDSRAALRRHFEIDAESIALAALHELSRRGEFLAERVARARDELGLDPEKPDPM